MPDYFPFKLPVRVEPDARKSFRLAIVDADGEVVAFTPDNRRRYKEAASHIADKLNNAQAPDARRDESAQAN